MYMARTRTGDKRHLIRYRAIVEALSAYKPAGPECIPALCGARITDGDDVLIHSPRFDGTRQWAVPYAAHWDDGMLCRHCRAIERRAPEWEPTTCNAIGCEVELLRRTRDVPGLALCPEHHAMLGDA